MSKNRWWRWWRWGDGWRWRCDWPLVGVGLRVVLWTEWVSAGHVTHGGAIAAILSRVAALIGTNRIVRTSDTQGLLAPCMLPRDGELIEIAARDRAAAHRTKQETQAKVRE